MMRTLLFYLVGSAITAFALLVGLASCAVPFSQPVLFFIAHWIWSPVFLWAAGGKLTVSGRLEALDPERSYVFVANHASYLDIAALFRALRRFDLRFVTKRELLWVPLLGIYLWRLGCPIVDRGNHKRAVATMARAHRKIREGTPILVFAEGTRTRTGEIGSFKKGAAVLAVSAGVPLVPIAIRGTFAIFRRARLLVRGGPIQVRVGSAINTEGLTVADRDALTSRLRAAVVEGFDALGGPPAPRPE